MAAKSRHSGKGRSEPGGAALLPPLVEAKLALPSLHRAIVDRPRTRQALDAGSDGALTLVAAPAGYGKTTAVRDWCASRDAAVAWVTLDADDNDPARLWTYVASAVDRVRPGLGRGALQRLSVPGGSIEDAVDELMNGAAALGTALVVVLDDLHAVTDVECLSSIDRALAHMPANVRMIVATRVDPALNVARLRAAGILAEVRASELVFTAAEARELLVVRDQVALPAGEIDVLIERTEGWPAALVLAGLWLRSVDDPAQAVRAFGGEHRYVAEYLSSEVLASLDDDRRSFLLGAAVLGEFTAELCDSVLDRTDSAAALAELEHSNLFVLRLERGGWFRVHSLFAEYARAHLASSEPAAAARIHRRAAEWLRSRGLVIEATAHAAAAGDHELVAELLVEYHLPLIRNGAGGTVLRRVRTLPDECIARHPELAVAGAIAAVLGGGSTSEQRRLLRLAERTHADPYVEGWALVARALTFDGGVDQALQDARRAVEFAQAGADEVLSGALGVLARALFFAGDIDEASAVAGQVLEHPDADRRAPSLTHARTTLALVAAERGRFAAARRHAEKAKAAVGGIGTSRSWLGANASAALGVVLDAEGHFAEAEHELATAERLFENEVASLHHAWLLVLLARVRIHRGRLGEAEAVLGAAREALDEIADSGRVPALADEAEREFETAKARAQSGEMLEPPSEAELAVLRLLASDLSTREIGERLFLSPNTIRSHKRALYHKLAVHSRTDAIARATALGLLEQADSPR